MVARGPVMLARGLTRLLNLTFGKERQPIFCKNDSDSKGAKSRPNYEVDADAPQKHKTYNASITSSTGRTYWLSLLGNVIRRAYTSGSSRSLTSHSKSLPGYRPGPNDLATTKK